MLITEIPTSQSRPYKQFVLVSVKMKGKIDWSKFFLYCLKDIHHTLIKKYNTQLTFSALGTLDLNTVYYF